MDRLVVRPSELTACFRRSALGAGGPCAEALVDGYR